MKINNRKENQKKSDGKQTKASKDLRGSLATEVPEFIPTELELLQIVEYWYVEDLRIQWNYFRFGEGPEPGLYSLSRIGDIRKLLSKEKVDNAIDAAIKQAELLFGQNPLLWSREVDTRHWDIFLHGDEEQWKAARDELWQDFGRWQKGLEVEEKEKENLGA